MNILTLQVLFALLAGAEAALPGNLATECETVLITVDSENKVQLGPTKYRYKRKIEASCGPKSARVRVDLDECIKNDNGQLAWGKEYVSPLGSPLVKFLIYSYYSCLWQGS